MKRALKIAAAVLLAVPLLKACWMTAARREDKAELLARKAYLVSTLDADRSKSAGLIGAEWELVSLSMTALAATNLAFEYPETRPAALDEVHRLANRALEKRVRAFDEDMWGEDPLATLDGDNGHIGYLGHLDVILGAYRALGGDDPKLVALNRAVTRSLARRMSESPFPYLETYPGAIWTADNAVVVAAIGIFDEVEKTAAHRALLDAHVAYTKRHLLDPKTGLVVFRVTSDGRPLGVSRGSGIGWNSIYLPFVDEAFARDQAGRLRDQFTKRLPFGCAGIREFAVGVDGEGDVDSGPLIAGVSPSGTGFAVAAMRTLEDEDAAHDLLDTAEFAGMTLQLGGGRRYLVGPLVGDASVLAARTQRPWQPN